MEKEEAIIKDDKDYYMYSNPTKYSAPDHFGDESDDEEDEYHRCRTCQPKQDGFRV